MESLLGGRQFRPTKKVSLGIDLGSSYVRAALWSTSKRRPAVLTLSRGSHAVIEGPGTEYALENWNLDLDNPIRLVFIKKCVDIFNIVTDAVESHYGAAMHVDYHWVSIVTAVDDTYYRQAVEEAASRVKNFKITRFLSCQLACQLGARAYLQFMDPNHKSLSPKSSSLNFVVDIGASAARFGLLRVVNGTETKMISANTTKEISTGIFQKIVEEALSMSTDNSPSVIFGRNIGADGFCKRVSESDNEYKDWFLNVVKPLLEKIMDMVKTIYTESGRDEIYADQLILTGSGIMLPGVSNAIIDALGGGKSIGNKFVPRWTPELFVAALGAAVQTGIDRNDRTCNLKSVDMNTNKVFLQVHRICNEELNIQNLLVLKQSSTFPFVSGLIIGRGVEEAVVSGFKLCEEVVAVDGSRQLCDICEVTLDESLRQRALKNAWKFSIIISKYDEGIRTQLTINFIADETEVPALSSSDHSYMNQRKNGDTINENSSKLTVKSTSDHICKQYSSSSLEPNKIASTVILQIIRAEGLRQSDMFRRCNPYCVILFNGEKLGDTEVIKKSLNPEWNKRFYLSIPNFVLTSGDILAIDLYDHDKFKSDEFLGRATITGIDIAKHNNEICCNLGRREDLPEKKQKHVQGKLFIRFFKHEFRLSQSMLDFSQFAAARSEESRQQASDDDDEDTDDESDSSVDLSSLDLRMRWRVLSGNVPVQGFITLD